MFQNSIDLRNNIGKFLVACCSAQLLR